MKLIYVFTAIALTATSCGNSTENATDVTDISDAPEVVDLTGNSHAPRTIMHIDSLANQADFLTTGEGVSVLVAYAEVIDESLKAGKVKSAYETMRKFVDLYNIVNNNHRQEFRSAVEKIKRSSGADLTAMADKYREKLSDYDDASGLINLAPKNDDAKPDSTATETHTPDGNGNDSTAQAEPEAVTFIDMD